MLVLLHDARCNMRYTPEYMVSRHIVSYHVVWYTGTYKVPSLRFIMDRLLILPLGPRVPNLIVLVVLG